MRITIKGILIFCSLIAGLILAEMVGASSEDDAPPQTATITGR
ncbi:MAG TPA: hypothetical protein VG498_17940 [Terriglobales bacterium]|nr:hypothetical protein [Terriglobales bacterium]